MLVLGQGQQLVLVQGPVLGLGLRFGLGLGLLLVQRLEVAQVFGHGQLLLQGLELVQVSRQMVFPTAQYVHCAMPLPSPLVRNVTKAGGNL